MHWRGHSTQMDSLARYSDVVSEVIDEVQIQLDKALSAGIPREKIILDPGLGLAKGPEHNWEILQRTDEFAALGYPVLIGHSRKRFLGGDNPEARDGATLEVSRTLLSKGIWGVRVHNVESHVKIAQS